MTTPRLSACAIAPGSGSSKQHLERSQARLRGDDAAAIVADRVPAAAVPIVASIATTIPALAGY